MSGTISIIFLIAITLAIVGGYFGGFGKVLVFITKGVWGKIAAVVICYSLFGVVLNMGFVQELLYKFTSWLKENPNFLKNILLYSRIDLIVFAVGFYFLVRYLLKLLARLVNAFMSAENKFMKILNKTLGVISAVAFAMITIMLIFQIMYWISGPSGGVYDTLRDTFLRLDRLYINNPFHSIIRSFIR